MRKEYSIFANSDMGATALISDLYLRVSEKDPQLLIISDKQLIQLQKRVFTEEEKQDKRVSFPLKDPIRRGFEFNNEREPVETTYGHASDFMFRRNTKWWGSKIKVTITKDIYTKLVNYVLAVESEISGFGKIIKKGNNIEIVDIKIFKQSCSAAGTTLNQEALQDFLYGLIKNGENPADWKLWWHTHYDFGASWSYTDESNITRLSQDGYLVSVCINQMLSNVVRIDHKDRHTDLTPIKNIFVTNDKVRIACQEEVKKLVKQRRGVSWNSVGKQESWKCGNYPKRKSRSWGWDPWGVSRR